MSGDSSTATPTQDPTRQVNGQKVMPRLSVTRVKTTQSGAKMQTYGWIQNDSPFAIEVTGGSVAGQRLAVRQQLEAGRGKEVKLYDGATMTNNRYDDALIDFRIVQNGDYFQQKFHIEYEYQHDGSYLIEELHAEAYTRDT